MNTKTVNVAQSINRTLWRDLSPKIAECSADSVVGSGVITLLNRFEALMAIDELESEIYESLRENALHQCNVWYFG